jgi:hypothetical protein
LPPSSLTQGSNSTSISMEHGHVQVSGASMSLEAVVSVVSSRAMSNQDIVPRNKGAPPIKEGCDKVLWKLESFESSSMWHD